MTILSQEKPAHAAAAARLQTEPVIWLTTVTPSGQPQSTPVWFLWEDDSYGWTPEGFATDYPHVIRVSPTRARIW